MLQKPGCDSGRKAKVMVCEDEFVVALDMQLMIEEFGFIVQGPYPSLKRLLGKKRTERKRKPKNRKVRGQ